MNDIDQRSKKLCASVQKEIRKHFEFLVSEYGFEKTLDSIDQVHEPPGAVYHIQFEYDSDSWVFSISFDNYTCEYDLRIFNKKRHKTSNLGSDYFQPFWLFKAKEKDYAFPRGKPEINVPLLANLTKKYFGKAFKHDPKAIDDLFLFFETLEAKKDK